MFRVLVFQNTRVGFSYSGVTVVRSKDLGICTARYDPADVALALCYVCGRRGHLACRGDEPEASAAAADAPLPVARPSCYVCGEAGHYGETCTVTPEQFGWEQVAMRGSQAWNTARTGGGGRDRWNSGGGGAAISAYQDGGYGFSPLGSRSRLYLSTYCSWPLNEQAALLAKGAELSFLQLAGSV